MPFLSAYDALGVLVRESIADERNGFMVRLDPHELHLHNERGIPDANNEPTTMGCNVFDCMLDGKRLEQFYASEAPLIKESNAAWIIPDKFVGRKIRLVLNQNPKQEIVEMVLQ